jgi:hypothetical protein
VNSISATAALVPPIGRQTTTRTVRDWIVIGLARPDGRRVKLAATRIGKRFGIRRDDLKIFLATVAGKPVALADETEVANVG